MITDYFILVKKAILIVLLRTPITQMIFFNWGMLLLGSNHLVDCSIVLIPLHLVSSHYESLSIFWSPPHGPSSPSFSQRWSYPPNVSSPAKLRKKNWGQITKNDKPQVFLTFITDWSTVLSSLRKIAFHTNFSRQMQGILTKDWLIKMLW